MKEAPSFEGASPVSGTPQREALGGGVLVTVVRGWRVHWQVLTLDHRVLLRQCGTQLGTLDYNSGHIGFR